MNFQKTLMYLYLTISHKIGIKIFATTTLELKREKKMAKKIMIIWTANGGSAPKTSSESATILFSPDFELASAKANPPPEIKDQYHDRSGALRVVRNVPRRKTRPHGTFSWMDRQESKESSRWAEKGAVGRTLKNCSLWN